MQTALGMRRLGYTVMLEEDAVFSSETNTGPALKRMQQAGIELVDLARVQSYAGGDAPLPDAPVQDVARATPGEVGIVLNALAAESVSASSDPWRAAKLARLKELLLISEWFDIPLYATDPSASLPAELQGVLSKTILDASEIATSQLVIAGTDDGLDALIDAHTGTRTLFLMEDALIGDAALRATLDARYDDGDVPLTYKSFYYEMTSTVAFEDWPADWIERDAEYYERTVAPEDLPPITP
jgi:hypothetical protein